MAADDDLDPVYGFDAYVTGLRLTYYALVLIVVVNLFAPALGGVGVVSSAVPDVGGYLLVALLLALAVSLVVAAFFAVFVYVSAHNVAVEFVGGTAAAPVHPPPFPVEEARLLYYLLPVAVLLWAGFSEYRETGTPVGAVVSVTIQYAVVAVLTIVPVAWLFNEILLAILAGFVGAAAPSAGIQYPDLLRAHLVVGLGYPLVFGGLGVGIGYLVSGAPSGGPTGARGGDATDPFGVADDRSADDDPTTDRADDPPRGIE